jgi:hypothetical protein
MTDAFRSLAARSEAVPYHASLGIRVDDVEADRVRIRIPYADANSNPGRALHGGVYASAIHAAGVLAAAGLADAAGASYARSLGLLSRRRDRRDRRRRASSGAKPRTPPSTCGTMPARRSRRDCSHRAAPPGPPDRDLRGSSPCGTPAGDVPSLARALVAVRSSPAAACGSRTCTTAAPHRDAVARHNTTDAERMHEARSRRCSTPPARWRPGLVGSTPGSVDGQDPRELPARGARRDRVRADDTPDERKLRECRDSSRGDVGRPRRDRVAPPDRRAELSEVRLLIDYSTCLWTTTRCPSRCRCAACTASRTCSPG